MPRVQQKRGTSANLASVNPTPLAGELVWDSTENAIKIGDGATTWTSLAYVTAAPRSHASTHATGGSDALTPGDIGAAPAASPTFTGTVTVPGLTSTSVILADDAATAGSVVYSFDGDPNTGIGRGGADVLTVVTSGSERVRVRADGNVGIGFAGYGTAKAAVAGAVSQAGGAYPAAVYDACVFYSDPAQGTKNAWAFWSASAPAESQGFSNFGHFLASRVAPSDTSNHYGVFCSVSGATNNYAFFANNSSAAGSFNFYASGNATNYFAGNVGIGSGTTSPTAALDINSNKIRLRTAKTPASASDTGNAGDICWDASYLYICTATNTWRRIAHDTW